MVLSMAWPAETLTDCPATAKKTTRPTPIINAAAVVDVRFGLRMAFSRARCPVTPRRDSGAPMSRLTGAAKVGTEEGHAHEHEQRAEARRRSGGCRRW